MRTTYVLASVLKASHELHIESCQQPSRVATVTLLLFSHQVVSDSQRLHGLQHTRSPCPSPSPRVAQTHSIESVIHPTISSSVAPFSCCLQSFPASGSFPVSQLFRSGGQSTGASVLRVNIQGWFLLGLTGLTFLLSKGLSRIFSSTTIWKHHFFGAQPSLWCNSHIHTWLLEKPQLWQYRPLSARWCLCFLLRSLGLSQLFF